MCPIPGEPHDPKPQELDLKDGRKVTFSFPGMPQPRGPQAAEEHDAGETPSDDPRPPLNPDHTA